MANLQTPPEQLIEGNDPFGMSRFSLRRYSVQHFLLIVVTHVLLIALLVTSVFWGNAALIALSALAWAVVMVKTVLVVWVGIRTIAVEAWIRRLGRGDFEHNIEPRGNDEVSKACQALETLRLRSIEVVRLQLVEKLGDELADANAVLETRNQELDLALSKLREAQDQIVAQQKLGEMIDLATGVAHEIRNPLNFVSNFCDGSAELLDELMETLNRNDRDDGEIEEISNELRANMDHIRRNLGRADRVLQGMLSLGTSSRAWQEVGLNLLVRQSVRAALDAYVAVNGGKQPVVEVLEDPSDPQCLALPEGMALAVMNLVQNACEAVEITGKSDAHITVSIDADEEEGCITIRDEGCGMAPEVLERALTPFFTTKMGDNQGAGLGLCQAAEVARVHGGNVVLESTAGMGSIATLTLQRRPPIATATGQDA